MNRLRHYVHRYRRAYSARIALVVSTQHHRVGSRRRPSMGCAGAVTNRHPVAKVPRAGRRVSVNQPFEFHREADGYICPVGTHGHGQQTSRGT